MCRQNTSSASSFHVRIKLSDLRHCPMGGFRRVESEFKVKNNKILCANICVFWEHEHINISKRPISHIWTWIDDSRTRTLTTWVIVCVESDCEVESVQLLHLGVAVLRTNTLMYVCYLKKQHFFPYTSIKKVLYWALCLVMNTLINKTTIASTLTCNNTNPSSLHSLM